MTHWLVTGTSAQELERLTGLRGRDTLLGVMVEKPRPFNVAAMARWGRCYLNMEPNRRVEWRPR